VIVSAMAIALTSIPGFAGRALVAGDAAYDAARAVFNGAIDRRPAVIAQVSDARDVAAALRHANEQGLPVAVRAGGHSGAGFGVIDDGLVIDVRALKRVEVDLARRTVRAGAGLTWGELDAATQAHGLAVTGGRVSSTGVAGLTLGSGSGWLERLHGLTADNLVGATVVTADGSTVHTNAHEHPDLFWALRGGGGNFGVVTEFELRLHRVGPQVLAGMMLFDWRRACDVLAGYRTVMREAPDALGGCAALMRAPAVPIVPPERVGHPVLALTVAAFGDASLIAPLRALSPCVDDVRPRSYVTLQSMLDAGKPHGMQNCWRAGFLADLDDAVIADVVERVSEIPSPLSTVYLQPLGGAYARVPEGATPLGHRDARWSYHALSMWRDAARTPVNREWTLALDAALSSYTNGAALPNLDSDPGADRTRALYGASAYERLVAVKDRWDPDNLFAVNHNIQPTPRP
jgi:FAD/FMN-containing dehydrogenase